MTTFFIAEVTKDHTAMGTPEGKARKKKKKIKNVKLTKIGTYDSRQALFTRYSCI